jgi:hypothetical protein
MLTGVLLISSCATPDEKTQIKNMFIDITCNYTKKIRDNISLLSSADTETMKKIRDDNTKLNEEMEKIPQKYGFKNEGAIEEALNKYETDEQFEPTILKAIKDTCGYDLESLDAL